MGVLKVVPKNECVGHEYIRGRDTLYPLKFVALRSFVEFLKVLKAFILTEGQKLKNF
jgi:hypothetical protein